MARTDIPSPEANQRARFHSPKLSLVSLLYVVLIITVVIFIVYIILKKLLAPFSFRTAISIAKATRFDRQGQIFSVLRANMETMGTYGHTGDIVFTENHKKQGLYNLHFILKASVDVLGRGGLGTTYKVILRDGSMVAVKRLKETSLKQKDFEQHMCKLGRLVHIENLVQVQSYYYSKGLTFIIYDYMCLGSLSSLLQGGKKCNHTPLDWPTRLAVAIDIAHALNDLHSHSIVHGNIKSNNIFLKVDFTPMLSEYGLVQLSLPIIAEEATLGYKAPELMDASAPDYMSDIYSFGVLLMELLTGIPPSYFTNRKAGSSEESVDTSTSLYAANLPEWVAKMTHEKHIQDVFDPQLSAASFETTIVQMLHVATACISTLIESRPSMSMVVKMMEHIKFIQERGDHPLTGKALSDAMSDAAAYSSLAVMLPSQGRPLASCWSK